MALEINLDVGLDATFSDGGTVVFVDGMGQQITLVTATQKRIRYKQTFSTSPEALVLGEVAATNGLIAVIHNLSTTAGEYLDFKNGTGGTLTLRIQPGETWAIPFTASAAPFGVAGTGTPSADILLIER